MGLRTVLLAAAILFLQLTFSMTSQEFLLLHKRGDDGLAPLYGVEYDTRISNEYIVLFQPGYTIQEHFGSIGMDWSNDPRFEPFSHGYRAKLDNITLNSLVRMDSGVLCVETNRLVEMIQPVDSYKNDSKVADKQKREYRQAVEQHAPYGLQMLGSAGKLSWPVSDDGQYDYVWGAGQGVNVYVFDSGIPFDRRIFSIRTSHTLFDKRASHFGGGGSQDKSKYTDEINDDLVGHGTHIAGIIGAQKYGVAPWANLISVKVLGKGQEVFRITQALVDVTAEHRANKSRNPNGVPWRFRGSIVNMSFKWEGDGFAMLRELISANEAGITVFASAGNENKDSSRLCYPCSYPETECVGAIDRNYAFAHYSNYGGVVGYLAPGTDVLSLGVEDDESLVSKVPSGTGTLLINTGIHSPLKYEKEPFRWAGDYPISNHDINFLVTTTDMTAVASGVPLSGVAVESYKTMETTTVADHSGLKTMTGSTTWDPSIAALTSTTSLPTDTAGPVPPPGGVSGQQIAWASYTGINGFADPDPDGWRRLMGYDSSKVSVVIANVNHGPDSVVDTNWQKAINLAISSGKRVLGYVGTGQLGSSQQQLTTRLSSRDLADWVAQIERDVDKWYELYGRGMGGIFFNEVLNDCGPDNIYSDLYAYINAYTKRRYPGAYTVLGSESSMPQCFENTTDTLLTFLSTYENYTSSYTPNDWTPADPRKIWHVIFNVPASAISTVVALAKQRGAGLVEVTDDTMDNPQETIPDDAYMKSFTSAVEGGSAPVADAPAAAGGPAAAPPPGFAVS
ncbi:hypothetical protein Daus18300_011587 [Diaporthe australafricana]|uniref:Peptidase S8/S53 domain-containing protein n=1 Tax=Diaporthe australafricana TaxID=127596 RepID=A0ABR3W5W0_9PEZI